MTHWDLFWSLPGKYELEYIFGSWYELNIAFSSAIHPRKRIYITLNCLETYQISSRKLASDLYADSSDDQIAIARSTNSLLMQWAADQAEGVFNFKGDCIHFSIISSDYVIDAINTQEPKIDFSEE